MTTFEKWDKEFQSQNLYAFNGNTKGLLWLKVRAICRNKQIKEFITDNNIKLSIHIKITLAGYSRCSAQYSITSRMERTLLWYLSMKLGGSSNAGSSRYLNHQRTPATPNIGSSRSVSVSEKLSGPTMSGGKTAERWVLPDLVSRIAFPKVGPSLTTVVLDLLCYRHLTRLMTFHWSRCFLSFPLVAYRQVH